MTKLLVDTHILLWALGEPEHLPEAVRRDLDDPAVTPLFSVISIWEVAIKSRLPRANLRAEPTVVRNALLRDGWEELAFTADHAIAAAALPLLHGDPFDRALVGQANAEAIDLVTSDKTLRDYPGRIRLI